MSERATAVADPGPPPPRRDTRPWRFALVTVVAVAGVTGAVVGTTALVSRDGAAPADAGPAAAVSAPGSAPRVDPVASPGAANPDALIAVASACRAADRPSRSAATAPPAASDASASQAAGRALLANPAVSPCPGAAAALGSGAVDGRLLALLALAADRWSYRLATIGLYDEDAAVTAVLTDLVDPADGGGGTVPAATAVDWFTSQRGTFRPPVAAVVDERTVVVSFSAQAWALVPATTPASPATTPAPPTTSSDR